MKYFVRTNGKRRLDKSYYQIDFEVLLDLDGDPVKSLIEQFKYISQYDAVLLEDDLILCKNFDSEINKAIKDKSKIYTFFSCLLNTDIQCIDNFRWSQARYYPKQVLYPIAERLYPFIGNKRTACYVTKVARELGYSMIDYRPCLVQHKDIDSYVGGMIKSKRSIIFIDYLNELGLDIESLDESSMRILLDYCKCKFIELNGGALNEY